jgi:hypothetical protein
MSAFPQTQFAATTLLTTGAIVGPQSQPAPSFWSQVAEGLAVGGQIASVFGAATSAIGAYYGMRSQQNQLRMQAQNAQFQAEMSRINRRAAEFTAGEVGRQGQLQAGRYTMGAGQARAGARAAMAGRGIALGQGSARDIIASMDIIKEIDRLNINASTVRAQEAARLQAFNLGTQATMQSLTASNLSATAGTIMPFFGAATSLLGSAADIGANWARNRRFEELLEGVSTRRI